MTTNKTRVQLDVKEDLIKDIDSLVAKSEGSRAEVLRDGVILLMDYVGRLEDGYILVYQKKDNPSDRAELLLPKYARIARNSQY